jgi:hypothetical protein
MSFTGPLGRKLSEIINKGCPYGDLKLIKLSSTNKAGTAPIIITPSCRQVFIYEVI